jgi:Site-specific recombinase XerD
MSNKKTRYKGVYQDSQGKFFYQAYLGINKITGKKIQRKGRKDRLGKPFDSAKEANDELMRVKVGHKEMYDYEDYNLSFEQFMDNVYLRAYQQKVQYSTYESALSQHKIFRKRFGKQKLRDISPRDCENFRLYLVEKYSPNYTRDVWSRFKACLGYAERLGYISRFPCKRLDNPKGSHPETKYWTYEEFKKVIQIINRSNYEEWQRFTTIWFYYMTGCRVSEGFALTWEDIDFNNRLLTIHATLEKNKDGEWYAKQHTKTNAGMRVIELDDVTLKILKEWRNIQVQNGDDDYIISRFGEPLNKSTLTRMTKRYAKLAGVPEITGKGLRHSHASYLINVLKMNNLYVSQRLGHADKTTTLNTYSHWYRTQNQSISDIITENINSEINLVQNQVKKSLPTSLPSKIA